MPMIHPISFTTDMVLAILDRRKTVTRRLIKPGHVRMHQGQPMFWTGAQVGYGWEKNPTRTTVYGGPGDRLRVREAHMHAELVHWPDLPHVRAPDTGEHAGKVVFFKAGFDRTPPHRWRPPMFMHHWASRLHLQIVDLRAERLREISHADALREGVEPDTPGDSAVTPFARLWDQINRKRQTEFDATWAGNPWTWRIEFFLCADYSERGNPVAPERAGSRESNDAP